MRCVAYDLLVLGQHRREGLVPVDLQQRGGRQAGDQWVAEVGEEMINQPVQTFLSGLRQDLGADLGVALQIVAEQGVEDVDLGRKVVEQGAGTDARPSADAGRRGPVDPVQGKLHRRRLDDLRPSTGVLLRIDCAHPADSTQRPLLIE